jgi:hypothetical protein
MKKLIIEKGKAFKINKGDRYLLIMPDDAKITTIAPAIAKFFDPVPVFVLIAKDVTQIKLAELIEEK